MKKFWHLEFVRNLKDDADIEKNENECFDYLLFDYFDYLFVREADNLQECAFGLKQSLPCEAYQGLGIFCEQEKEEEKGEKKEKGEQKTGLWKADPFARADNGLPFLSIFQLTLNPYCYKNEGEPDSGAWIRQLEAIIKGAFREKTDKAVFRIYQTVNAIDFCVIVISENLGFVERLSDCLKRYTFSLGDKDYLAFTVYENIGIHKEFQEEPVKASFSEQHALVARVKVKDTYWNGLEGIYTKRWGKTCRCSVLNGRYHFSARIEGEEEIVRTLREIIAYKFRKPVQKAEEEVNIIRRMLMEEQVEYLNERILFNGEAEQSAAAGDAGPQISQPKYNQEKRTVLESIIKELEEKASNLEKKQELQVYVEKLNNVYCMQRGLSENADTYINCKMFEEYFEAFLGGTIMTLELAASNSALMDDFIMQLKLGVRYLIQFIHIISSVNNTTFQAPKYELIQDMNANPKFSIAYTEFLREHVTEYRKNREENQSRADKEKEIFPHYIPLIIPKMSETSENFFMAIIYAQGFTDEWEKEREAWKAYVAAGKETPLFVVCQKYKTFANISDVLTLSFHEMGHYCNYLTREERNEDLLKMTASALAGMAIEEFRGARETEHFLNRSETIKISRIKQLNVLNAFLKTAIYEVLKKRVEEEKLQDAPEALFTAFLSQTAEALFAPVPAFYSRKTLQSKTMDFVMEKTGYHVDAKKLAAEFRGQKSTSGKQGKRICEYVFEQCQKEMEDVETALVGAEEVFNRFYPGEDGKGFYEAMREYVSASKQMAEYYLGETRGTGTYGQEMKKATDVIGKSLKKINVLQKKIREPNQASAFTTEEEAFSNQVQSLCDRTARVQRLLWEYDFLKTSFFQNRLFFDTDANGDIKEGIVADAPAFEPYQEKDALIRRVCQRLQCYFRENRAELEKPQYPLTLWERQMLERLQLTENMDSEHFCDMLEQAFFRVRGIDGSIRTLSMIYAEGFADLSMCRELGLNLREYLTVIAQFVKFRSKTGPTFRLTSVIIVVLVKLFEEDLKDKPWETFYKEKPGKELSQLFEERMRTLLEETNYKEYAENMEQYTPKNEFAGNFLALIKAIKDNLTYVAQTGSVYPLFDRMTAWLCQENGGGSAEKLAFVRKSLNQKFAEAFLKEPEKPEKVVISERISDECNFMTKYYYHNRKRYMTEAEGKSD